MTCPSCRASCEAEATTCTRCGYQFASGSSAAVAVGGVIMPRASTPVNARRTAQGEAISDAIDPTLQTPTPGSPTPMPRAGSISESKQRLGTTLGSYRLLEVLGEGGMGCVFLAEHMRLGRRVALKTVRPEYAQNPQVIARFFAEARAVNKISHEHIVEITDFVENVGGDNYYIMEHLKGRSLGDIKRETSVLSLGRAIGISAQVCSALAAVHEAGILHRDLKPDNIFITERSGQKDFVKILDFGVAKLMDIGGSGSDVQLHETAAGVILGTPDYMSPEQARSRPTDFRTDIYSLGVILYELVTGRKPLEADTFGDMIVKHTTDVVVPPTKVPGVPHTIPPSLEALIMQCLEKDPLRRPNGMREIEARLRAIAANETLPLEVYDPATGVARAVPPRKSRVAPIGGLILAVALVGIGVYKFLPRDPPPPALGTLTIESVPPGATVTVDGVRHGTTPVRVPDVVVGERTVALALDGYEAVTLPTRVERAGQEVPLTAVLKALHGTLEVTSTPTGALIELDGVSTGKSTPAVFDVGRGKHEITVALPEHQPAKELIDVGAEPARLELALTPREPAVPPPTLPTSPPTAPPGGPPPPQHPRVPAATGLLDLETRPYTTVFFNGKKLGDTPLIGVRLPAGSVNLVLVNEAEGIRETYSVSIARDGKTTKRLKLK